VRDKIGMVFQEGALFDSLSVRDNVAYRLHEDDVPEEEVESEVRQLLRFVDLDNTTAYLRKLRATWNLGKNLLSGKWQRKCTTWTQKGEKGVVRASLAGRAWFSLPQAVGRHDIFLLGNPHILQKTGKAMLPRCGCSRELGFSSVPSKSRQNQIR